MGMLLARHREERAGNETTSKDVESKPKKTAAKKAAAPSDNK